MELNKYLIDSAMEVEDYSPIIQRYVNNLKTGEKLTITGGIFQCNSTLDFSKLPQFCSIECNGRLKFAPGIDGIIIGGASLNIYINSIDGYSWSENPNYDEYTGTGIMLNNVSFSTITINSIHGFKYGLQLYGTNSNGVYYNQIHLNRIRQCDVSIRFSCSNGFVNSNRIFGGFLYGNSGLVIEREENEKNTFNNNTFYGMGFERLKKDVCKLRYAHYNTFYSCRFEGGVGSLPTSGWIDEDSTNRGNIFIVDIPIPLSRLDLQNGRESIVLGNIFTDDGRRASFFKTRASRDLFFSDKRTSGLPENTIFFRTDDDFSGFLAGIRKEDANLDVGQIAPLGFHEINNSDYSMSRSDSTLYVYSNTAPVTIKMNKSKEINGSVVYVEVRRYGNPITILNSSGTPSSAANINQEGMWMLIYTNWRWRAVRIGD